VTARTGEIRERGKPWKRWNKNIEYVLRIIGIVIWHRMARDRKEWKRTVLEEKVQNGMWCLRRVGGGTTGEEEEKKEEDEEEEEYKEEEEQEEEKQEEEEEKEE